jgi:hypothetical protein
MTSIDVVVTMLFPVYFTINLNSTVIQPYYSNESINFQDIIPYINNTYIAIEIVSKFNYNYIDIMLFILFLINFCVNMVFFYFILMKFNTKYNFLVSKVGTKNMTNEKLFADMQRSISANISNITQLSALYNELNNELPNATIMDAEMNIITNKIHVLETNVDNILTNSASTSKCNIKHTTKSNYLNVRQQVLPKRDNDDDTEYVMVKSFK